MDPEDPHISRGAPPRESRRPPAKSMTWTDEMELRFLESHVNHGNKWSAIAAEGDGWTAADAKNHWYSLLRSRTNTRQRSLLYLYASLCSASGAGEQGVGTVTQRSMLRQAAIASLPTFAMQTEAEVMQHQAATLAASQLCTEGTPLLPPLGSRWMTLGGDADSGGRGALPFHAPPKRQQSSGSITLCSGGARRAGSADGLNALLASQALLGHPTSASSSPNPLLRDLHSTAAPYFAQQMQHQWLPGGAPSPTQARLPDQLQRPVPPSSPTARLGQTPQALQSLPQHPLPQQPLSKQFSGNDPGVGSAALGLGSSGRGEGDSAAPEPFVNADPLDPRLPKRQAALHASLGTTFWDVPSTSWQQQSINAGGGAARTDRRRQATPPSSASDDQLGGGLGGGRSRGGGGGGGGGGSQHFFNAEEAEVMMVGDGTDNNDVVMSEEEKGDDAPRSWKSFEKRQREVVVDPTMQDPALALGRPLEPGHSSSSPAVLSPLHSLPLPVSRLRRQALSSNDAGQMQQQEQQQQLAVGSLWESLTRPSLHPSGGSGSFLPLSPSPHPHPPHYHDTASVSAGASVAPSLSASGDLRKLTADLNALLYRAAESAWQ